MERRVELNHANTRNMAVPLKRTGKPTKKTNKSESVFAKPMKPTKEEIRIERKKKLRDLALSKQTKKPFTKKPFKKEPKEEHAFKGYFFNPVLRLVSTGAIFGSFVFG